MTEHVDQDEPLIEIIDLRDPDEIGRQKGVTRAKDSGRLADRGVVTSSPALLESIDGGTLFAPFETVSYSDSSVDELLSAGAPEWLVKRAKVAIEQSDLATAGAPNWLQARAAAHTA